MNKYDIFYTPIETAATGQVGIEIQPPLSADASEGMSRHLEELRWVIKANTTRNDSIGNVIIINIFGTSGRNSDYPQDINEILARHAAFGLNPLGMIDVELHPAISLER